MLQGMLYYIGTIQRVLDVLGTLDGSHINIKVVPWTQRDSYVDRYMSHSINAMVISNAALRRFYCMHLSASQAQLMIHGYYIRVN